MYSAAPLDEGAFDVVEKVGAWSLGESDEGDEPEECPTGTSIPAVVHLKDELCSNSGSNISECSENDVNVFINSIDSEYASKFSQQLQNVKAAFTTNTADLSDQRHEREELPQHHDEQPCTTPTALPCCDQPVPPPEHYCDQPCCVPGYSGCDDYFDANCVDCVSQSQQNAVYGFNNNATMGPEDSPLMPEIPDGVVPQAYNYLAGINIIQQQAPQAVEQSVVYTPPTFQPPIFYCPPEATEEWITLHDSSPAGTLQAEQNIVAAYEQCRSNIVDNVDGRSFQFTCPNNGVPSIQISEAGLIVVELQNEVIVEMTLDHGIRVVNKRHQSVIAINNVGNESCLFHKGVRIKHSNIGGRIDAEMFHHRRVSISPEEINFASRDKAFQLKRDIIAPVPVTVFTELSQADDTVSMLYSASGYGPSLYPKFQEVIAASHYNGQPDGGGVTDINNVKIKQDRNGDVSVMSQHKRIVVSPASGLVEMRISRRPGVNQFEATITPEWNVTMASGNNTLEASNDNVFHVSNGEAAAGFDITGKLFTYKLAEPRRPPPRNDRGRPRYIAPMGPSPHFMGPPPFPGFRGPRPRYPMGPPRWGGPRGKFPPNGYGPPRFRGGRRGNNQTWRRNDRQQERRPEVTQSAPETAAKTDEEEEEKRERPVPMPRKRTKNFKREQPRDQSSEDTDDDTSPPPSETN